MSDIVWTLAPDVAWLQAEPDAVAAVLLSADPTDRPMLIPEPWAILWRALAEAPRTERQLAELIDDAQAHDLVRDFLAALAEAKLVAR